MSEFAQTLLDWYDENARELPWRVGPEARMAGVRPDPYRVWLSEIMLQQTTIPHGIRYFLKFTEIWPNVEALAAANRDDIMREWAGLGYYTRARNLHACAKQVAELGGFPEDAKSLQALPGIGPYTAGAIAAIAFDQSVSAVDGNVERVLTRFLRIETPLPAAKAEVKAAVDARLPEIRAGDFAQAMMDLGATVCTPRNPACPACPLATDCASCEAADVERFPVKVKKQKQPLRYGRVYLIHDGKRLKTERRPDKGLLAGMTGLPTTEWKKVSIAPDIPECGSSEGKYLGRVEHVFTHFRLYLDVYERIARDIPSDNSLNLSARDNHGLPSVFAKALALFQGGNSRVG